MEMGNQKFFLGKKMGFYSELFLRKFWTLIILSIRQFYTPLELNYFKQNQIQLIQLIEIS